MTKKYTPNLLHVDINSAYVNGHLTSDERLIPEPNIFKTGDVLPVDMIRHLNNP